MTTNPETGGEKTLRPDTARLRQKGLAEFGIFALGDNTLDQVLSRACESAADAMERPLAKIAQLQDDGRLYVRAYHGYHPSAAARWLETGRGSSAGHALMTGNPTVSGDSTADPRFDTALIEDEDAVRSVVNVLIPDILNGGGWWGVLECDSHRLDAFSQDEVLLLTQYANLIAAAVAQHGHRERLETLVEEKSKLFQELQHRVKNNLAVVTGLVRLQARRASSADAREELRSVVGRIEILQLMHEALYSSDEADRIALDDYLARLIDNLSRFHDLPGRGVTLKTEIAPLTLPSEEVIPLGLILNEFVTNSMKYAFGTAGGQITATVERHADGGRLRLTDDGSGLPDDRRGGTGMRLIDAMTRQIDGRAEWTGGPGTTLSVTFPLERAD